MKQKPLFTVDGETLTTTLLPPVRFVVEGFIPQGLHLLAGASKIGKSWLALWLCLQVAKGEKVWDFPSRRGDVLYLCLEDNIPVSRAACWTLPIPPREICTLPRHLRSCGAGWSSRSSSSLRGIPTPCWW